MTSYVLGQIDKNKSYFVGRIETAVRLNDFCKVFDGLSEILQSNDYPKDADQEVRIKFINEELNKQNFHLLSFDYLLDADIYDNEYNGFRLTSYRFNSKAKTQAIKLMQQIILEQSVNMAYGWDGKNFFFSSDENDFIYTIIFAKEINKYIEQGKFAPITVPIYKNLCNFYEWSKGNEYEEVDLVRLARYIFIHMNSEKATGNDVLVKENGEYKIVDKNSVKTHLINTNALNYCASFGMELDKQYVFLSSCRRLIPNF